MQKVEMKMKATSHATFLEARASDPTLEPWIHAGMWKCSRHESSNTSCDLSISSFLILTTTNAPSTRSPIRPIEEASLLPSKKLRDTQNKPFHNTFTMATLQVPVRGKAGGSPLTKAVILV